MDDVKINTSKTLTLTLPSDPTSNIVSTNLYHEFGSQVSRQQMLQEQAQAYIQLPTVSKHPVFMF